MRIVLAPYGSRGDVEPMLALALALRERGHAPVLAAPPDYAPLAEQIGVAFAPVAQPFGHFFNGTRNELRVFFEVFRTVPAQFEALEPVMENADMVIGAMLQFAAPSLAELRRIPYRYVVFSPSYLRSLHQPALSIPWRHPPRWLHHLLWRAQDVLLPVLGKVLLRERRRRGLPEVSSLYWHLAPEGKVLAAVDETLTPVPPDVGHVQTTGLWRRQRGGRLPLQVQHFLDAGPRPIFIGFGSLRWKQPERLQDLIVNAAERAGVRAILPTITGATPGSISNNCLAVAELPHDILFKRMAAIVHHGGAGTFASAAVAGCPQGVVAHLGDQYYHGYRVETLGVGPAPMAAGSLTVSRLARLMAQLTNDTGFATAAHQLDPRIRRDGTDQAVKIVEAIVAGAE